MSSEHSGLEGTQVVNLGSFGFEKALIAACTDLRHEQVRKKDNQVLETILMLRQIFIL